MTAILATPRLPARAVRTPWLVNYLKAEARLHIVEGLVKAVDMIDAVVKAIRAAIPV